MHIPSILTHTICIHHLLIQSFSLCAAFVPSSYKIIQSSSPAFHSTSSSSSSSALCGGYNSDPIMGSYWNRENSLPQDYSGKIVKEARIISLSDPNDANNDALHKNELPDNVKLLAIGSTVEQFDIEMLKAAKPNVIFVSHPKAREPLAKLIEMFPTIEWIHARSAGIDFITSPTLSSQSNRHITLTNAKGCFSSTLAEYTMMAISYFAKDLPRLLQNKQSKKWDRYDVLEVRGATLGIVGYGDIGRAAAKLADAYGMNVLALRRNPKRSMYDPYVKEVFGMEQMMEMVERCDYVLVAAPLTEDTRGLISAEVISRVKEGAVLINVGRGPIIDEDAMIKALQDGTLKGAAMDVTTIEPLPVDSPLWSLENVLLSPHNMDKTATFLKEATDMFVEENVPRFIRDLELLNPVDKLAGY